MKSEIFPTRLRWLAILLGVVSASTFYPSGFLIIYPVLLFGGGIIQTRFARPGRWLIWIGVIGLDIIIIQYDVVAFHDPVSYHDRVMFMFSALLLLSTILALWCTVELIVDGLKRVYEFRFNPSRPLNPLEWILVLIVNLWVAYSIVFSLIIHKYGAGTRVLWTTSMWVLFALLLDLSVMRNYHRSVILHSTRKK